MNRLLIAVAIPALAVFGCSSEHPQQAIHVSGSASVTPTSSQPKVVGTETKAALRDGTTEVEEYHRAEPARSTTEVETRTEPARTRTEVDTTRTEPARVRTDVDTTRTETTPPANNDIKPVKPVDAGTSGTRSEIKPVDGNLSPSGSVDLKASHSGYFEASKDGKTYVFATSDAMTRFNNGDTSIKFDQKTGANGERYWVQADHADTLSAEYNKAHPGK